LLGLVTRWQLSLHSTLGSDDNSAALFPHAWRSTSSALTILRPTELSAERILLIRQLSAAARWSILKATECSIGQTTPWSKEIKR